VLECARRNDYAINLAPFETERDQALDDGWSELTFHNQQISVLGVAPSHSPISLVAEFIG
jgi:hypothetical protein